MVEFGFKQKGILMMIHKRKKEELIMKNTLKTKRKELTVIITIVMLVVTAISIAKLLGTTFAGNTFEDANGGYIITDGEKLEAQFTEVSNKSAALAVVPDTIQINEQKFKVTSIKDNVLKDNKKVKKLIIGSNVKKIGKKAFYGCKNLKTIVIKTSNLTSTSVKADAFKGLNAKVVVNVPENKLAAYKKILKAKGLIGKKQKVVGKKMEIEEDKKEEEVPEVTFGPDHPLPDPEYAAASIGDITKAGSKYLEQVKVTDAKEYSIGDEITFSATMCMHPDIYGRWGKREAYGKWLACNVCGKKFSSDKKLAIHVAMTTDGCLGDCNAIEFDEAYTETYWIPDESPCRAVFRFTLPDGLSYKEDSVRLWHLDDGEVDRDKYQTNISGNELTVTIDNIKSEPFYNQDITLDSSYFRYPINILFNTEMNGSITAANTASVTVSYSCGGAEKTIDLGKFSVYSSTLQLKNTDASGNAITGSKFALYKEKITYTGNIGTAKFHKIAELTSTDGMLEFKGLGKGRYKLVQVSAPDGYKKAGSTRFNISMDGKDGSITSLAVKYDTGANLPWTSDTRTGVISAIVTNQ